MTSDCSHVARIGLQKIHQWMVTEREPMGMRESLVLRLITQCTLDEMPAETNTSSKMPSC